LKSYRKLHVPAHYDVAPIEYKVSPSVSQSEHLYGTVLLFQPKESRGRHDGRAEVGVE